MNRQIFSEKTTASVKTGKFDGNNRETSNVWARAKELKRSDLVTCALCSMS